VCAENGHALVVDACYSGFAGGFPQVTGLAEPGCTVVVSWSKLFGLAGARVAVVIADSALAHDLRAHGTEHQVSWIALHALEGTERVVASFTRVWADIAEERDAVRQRLIGAGHIVPLSGGNFLHCDTASAKAAEMVTRQLSERGFRVRNMHATTGLEHCVRFTVGCDEAARRFTGEVLLDVLAEVRPR
jgi:histidinol-phosphate/aromatic aminotransferase/cobyric acid decarboxylase-like protein